MGPGHLEFLACTVHLLPSILDRPFSPFLMALHDESPSSRGSTPSQRIKPDVDDKRPEVARRRSSAFKTEEEDLQGRPARISTPLSQRDTSRKTLKRAPSGGTPKSPMPKQEEDKVGGDITVKLEPGQAPKLSRSASKKLPLRPAPKFLELTDAGPEASRGFETLERCLYANKWIGTTDPALECDCQEEWGMPFRAMCFQIKSVGHSNDS